MKYEEQFYSELLRLLRKEGYQTEEIHGEAGDDYAIIKGGQMIGRITRDGDVYAKPGYGGMLETVVRIRDHVGEYIRAYNEAPPLEAMDIQKGYRKLSELGGYVLAAKQMKDLSFEFVTWQWDYNRRGVGIGHYYYEYPAAKEDFAVRTGLVDQYKIFNESELRLLKDCLLRCKSWDPNLKFDQESKINKAIEKIENILPEPNTAMQAEQEDEDEMEL